MTHAVISHVTLKIIQVSRASIIEFWVLKSFKKIAKDLFLIAYFLLRLLIWNIKHITYYVTVGNLTI